MHSGLPSRAGKNLYEQSMTSTSSKGVSLTAVSSWAYIHFPAVLECFCSCTCDGGCGCALGIERCSEKQRELQDKAVCNGNLIASMNIVQPSSIHWFNDSMIHSFILQTFSITPYQVPKTAPGHGHTMTNKTALPFQSYCSSGGEAKWKDSFTAGDKDTDGGCMMVL